VKVPLQIKFGMMAKQRERDIKELEEVNHPAFPNIWVVYCDLQAYIRMCFDY
jgi:hypothetical protein